MRAVPRKGPGRVAEIVVLNGASAGRVFLLADVPTVVGRSEEAHLLIADPWISSMHAMFERRGDEIWVVDLDSRNGTFVGDERVTEGRLADGAVVRFGRTEVRLDLGAANAPPPRAEPARAPRDLRLTMRSDRKPSRGPITARDPEAPAPDLAAQPATVLRMAVDAAGIEELAGAQERLRAALDEASRAASEAGAAVARLAGVGVLALFGVPQPSPDDATRAVAAARAARRAVRAQGGLDLRAAIETGPVLAAGAEGQVDLTALGPAAELAERLVALAAHGEILAGPGAGPAAGLAPAGRRSLGDRGEVDVFRAVDE
jgi:pSer/pThr/pTyr-binding forkhead associated (FHA) protein